MGIFTAVLLVAAVSSGSSQGPVLSIKKVGAQSTFSLGADLAFYSTSNKIESPRGHRIGDSQNLIAFWTETERGVKHDKVAISLDGIEVAKVAEVDHLIRAVSRTFDPITSKPNPNPILRAPGNNEVFIVQFQTQPLESYRDELKAAGATVYSYFPKDAFLVHMNAAAKASVERMPFVRSITPYHPDFKLDTQVRAKLLAGKLSSDKYSIAVLERGPMMKENVAITIRLLGGTVVAQIPDGFILEAVLDPGQLTQILRMNEIWFVDPKGEPSEDMDIVRSVASADMIESTYGYTGQGVRAEVMDGNLRTTHQAFLPRGVIIHRAGSGSTSHGTCTTGIVFGDGSGNILGRGAMPDAQPIFAGYSGLPNRYTHTAELLQSPYFCVFQSNSWGNNLVTTYTTISQQMDDILYQNNVSIFQSQSNNGNQLSRPEAWAKNIVAVGGITHFNTATRADDQWTGASIGPAADGRIKPDVSFFYDNILCPSNTTDTSYTGTFSGTSSATPMTAGLAGIFFQMWSDGFFYNSALASTVFDNRPKSSFVKAMLANTAFRYAFTGSTANLSRYKQGWGTADLGNIDRDRNSQFLINERDVLMNLQTKTYRLWVPPSTPEFRASMCYLDPPGNPGASFARINDLTLKVTSPSGTIYFGNNGLTAGNVSTSGGSANDRDTLECVMLLNPESGVWTVDVIGSDINTDARVETQGQIDADFSLVVTGVDSGRQLNVISKNGVTLSGAASDMATSNNVSWMLDGNDPNGPRLPMVTLVGDATIPGGTLSELRIRIESNSPTVASRLFVQLWNQNTSQYELVGNVGMSTTDTLFELVVGGNLSRFIRPGGTILASLSWQQSTRGPSMFANIDQVRFDMQP